MNRIDLNDDDVVSMSEEDNLLDGRTSKISELMSAIMDGLDRCYQTELCEKWVQNGADCQLLQVQGGGWKKGKIRIRLEFVSTESSPKSVDRLGSELDEFRTKLNQ